MTSDGFETLPSHFRRVSGHPQGFQYTYMLSIVFFVRDVKGTHIELLELTQMRILNQSQNDKGY